MHACMQDIMKSYSDRSLTLLLLLTESQLPSYLWPAHILSVPLTNGSIPI